MAEATDLVTVFRSADESAEEDAMAISELLSSSGLTPTVVNDAAPGVPAGAWEVHVPFAEVAQAEQLIADAPLPDEDLIEASDSPSLDTETVFVGSEMEVTGVRGVLEASGIATVTVGDAVLPNFAFEIRVAKEHVAKAKALIAEAEAAGPAAAEEAERATENPA